MELDDFLFLRNSRPQSLKCRELSTFEKINRFQRKGNDISFVPRVSGSSASRNVKLQRARLINKFQRLVDTRMSVIEIDATVISRAFDTLRELD